MAIIKVRIEYEITSEEYNALYDAPTSAESHKHLLVALKAAEASCDDRSHLMFIPPNPDESVLGEMFVGKRKTIPASELEKTPEGRQKIGTDPFAQHSDGKVRL